MENQRPFVTPNSMQTNQSSNNQQPTAIQQKTNLLPIAITAIICAVVFGLGGYNLGKLSLKLDNFTIVQSPSTSLSSKSPSPSNNPTLKWKSYINNKYGFSIQYPENYLIGSVDTVAGKFNDTHGNEDKLDILSSLNEEFNNFLEVQVVDSKIYNKTMSILTNEIYKKQKDHFLTTEISNLTASKFLGLDSNEYTFTGQALYTTSWDGTVAVGKYKVVMIEKNAKVYSFYLKDNEVFNIILSSFKFI